MRIHRIRLKNYRGVADCEVSFPTQGVTVIEGDNEVGKSCIPEALNLILSTKADSKSKEVKDIRPVHQDAGPEVEVEISSGQYRFTYFKRWHKKPETRLAIIEPQREQLAGREAHERVEAMLGETLDGDLRKALSIEQAANLGVPNLAVPSLGEALDLASGGVQAPNSDDALWNRVCAQRDQYWTPGGQESKERKALAKEVAQAQDAINGLEAQLLAIENYATEAKQLADEEGNFADRQREAAEAVDTLKEQWEATESLRNQVERLRSDRDAAQYQLQVVEGQRQRRQELVDEADNWAEAQATLEAEVEQAAPGLALAMNQSEEAHNDLRAAESALRIAQDKLRLANNDRDYRRNEIERDQLSERYERVISAQDSLKAAEAVLDSSQVDDQLVSQIEEAHLEETRAQAAFKASAPTVEATSMSAQTVIINDEQHFLGADETRESHVTGVWELVVPDTIQVRVKAENESQKLAVALERARDAYQHLCSQGGVQHLKEAQLKAGERRDAERSREEATKVLADNLRDLTPEVLAQKLQGLTRRVSSYPADRPDGAPLPGDHEEAKAIASEADRAAQECQEEYDRCKSIAEAASEASKKADIDKALQAQQLNHARGAKELAERKLGEARQSQPDSELEEALAAEEENLSNASAALEKAEKELQKRDPDSLKTKLDNARNVQARVGQELLDNQNRQGKLRAILEDRSGDGLHSQLNEAKGEHEQQVREHERLESRAQAAKLLHETFERYRREARQRYVDPFKKQIEQVGRIVFGPSFEVELDEDLRVVQRTLDGITLDLDQLSVGAREQIGVICRLACAAIVSPDGGGAPVMIDDALGWSDPERLQSMGAAIAAAGQDCQVIVLTCTPGRYANVGTTSVIRLPN